MDTRGLEGAVISAETLAGKQWTKPYCGVSHLGQLGDQRWATVTERGDWADVVLWSKHVSIFQAPTFDMDSVEQAKAAGEAWVRTGVMPSTEAA